MPGYIQIAGKPIPVEQLHGPNLIPVVIGVIFALAVVCAILKK